MKYGFRFILVLSFCFAALSAYGVTEKAAVSMKAHEENGISCADCHKTENPEKRAPASSCIECHENKDGTYKGILNDEGEPVMKTYAESSGTKTVNVHDSHQGELRCTVCHAYHKEPVLYCNECHSFDLKVR